MNEMMNDGKYDRGDFNGENTALEIERPYGNFSAILKVVAHFFSVIFHPLFIPIYVVVFLINFHPYFFSGFGKNVKLSLIFTTILNTVIFPALSVLLMKGLGFISSVFLHKRQDRIGPYLSSMIFYFWAARVFYKFQPQLPPELVSFMTAVFLTTIAALIANIYFKISMHAMACGGLTGFFIILMLGNSMWMAWPLGAALFITGIVCTSRLIISNHSTSDIYFGLFAGLACQFAAAAVFL